MSFLNSLKVSPLTLPEILTAWSVLCDDFQKLQPSKPEPIASSLASEPFCSNLIPGIFPHHDISNSYSPMRFRTRRFCALVIYLLLCLSNSPLTPLNRTSRVIYNGYSSKVCHPACFLQCRCQTNLALERQIKHVSHTSSITSTFLSSKGKTLYHRSFPGSARTLNRNSDLSM